ncbi:hypothetical protein [Streptomyces sp. NPDC058418]|uniref:hypothetical protein n=1 Tax=Streptomyces sp. NPDC058418 TaxID=3346488 RepID=UPI00365BCA48
MSTRPRFHPDDGRPRYTGPAVVIFPDGREVPVIVSLVLRYDRSRSDNRPSDRDSTWAGSITLADESSDVDFFDAAPGILRMPDGRESEFMATSGPRESGCSGLGPAPFVASQAGECASRDHEGA